MNFTFRQADAGDAALLTQMRLEMRRERETVILPVPESEFEQCTFDYFRQSLTDPACATFIASADEHPAACATLLIQTHAPSYSNLNGKTGYIFNVYTRPEWRHNGLAVKLLDHLICWAKQKGCTKIGLNASAAGRGVYLKYGFHEISGEMELDITVKS